MKINEHQWKSTKINRKSTRINEHQRTSTTTTWTSMKIELCTLDFHRFSTPRFDFHPPRFDFHLPPFDFQFSPPTKIYENRRKSSKICENQRKSTKINHNDVKIDENRSLHAWFSLIFNDFRWFSLDFRRLSTLRPSIFNPHPFNFQHSPSQLSTFTSSLFASSRLGGNREAKSILL